MGDGVGETGAKSVFWGKTYLVFYRPKLNFPHINLKFGQNRKCRGRKDLQLWYWTKLDRSARFGRKSRARSQFGINCTQPKQGQLKC
jgi:hypothetical protein